MCQSFLLTKFSILLKEAPGVYTFSLLKLHIEGVKVIFRSDEKITLTFARETTKIDRQTKTRFLNWRFSYFPVEERLASRITWNLFFLNIIKTVPPLFCKKNVRFFPTFKGIGYNLYFPHTLFFFILKPSFRSEINPIFNLECVRALIFIGQKSCQNK